MQLTVAMATYNRSHLLRESLDHLTRLRVPAGTWDLIVVDNASTDDTKTVASSFESRLPLQYRYESRSGLCHARNHALSHCRGDVIAFIDDDVLVDPDWLRTLEAAVARWPEAAAWGGPIEPWFPTEPDQILLKAFPRLANGFAGLEADLPAGLLPPPAHIYGASMAFRISALDGLRFDPRLGPSKDKTHVGITGEDVDFIDRLRARGGHVYWVPEMRVKHYVDPHRMTLPYLRRYTRGEGRMSVIRHGVPAGPRWFGVPRWMFRRYVEYWARACSSALTGSRVESLEWQRQAHFLAGQILQSRAPSDDR